MPGQPFWQPGYYQCDTCPHTDTAQSPMIHHRWQAHQLRGPVKHLRVAPIRRRPAGEPRAVKPKTPLENPPVPQNPRCTLPAVWVPSGIQTRIDIDAARARAYAEADPDILDLEFSVGRPAAFDAEAC